ncbi:hypothetical protein C1N83_24860 [Priestia aryabhattai]|uniref:hypothetical protein n=1 Tax=Priestia sp. SB1 TaxID=3132359 RepID=UPI00064EDA04|nr:MULTISPECIES: hypothetical protein [Priestia]KML30643.1 hypothetical protein VL11_05970 [Priestia aryabhattai]KMN99826.1 hypothetical protein ABV89_08035 [Priestia aryabhattai]KZE12770.1 hypothetical protein AVW12_04050 [Priestia aryabhattai]MBX9966899.1 hypothetical protein [Priestia aryabhattai]MBY0008367.1 hypothetical protein [Priestia aryabhattai]
MFRIVCAKGVENVEWKSGFDKERELIFAIQRNLDVVTAILLLTGQITIIGVFVTPGAFRISVGGPITGTSRIEGKGGDAGINIIIDMIDVILAALLLNNQINVSGAFISSGRFTINVSGPIFGVPKTEPALSELNQSSQFFHRTVSKHFYVNPDLVEKFTKD